MRLTQRRIAYLLGFTLAFSAGIGACASTPTIDQIAEDYRDRITLTVENNSWDQVSVFLVSRGQRRRLESFSAVSVGRTTIRRSELRDNTLCVIVRPIARKEYAVDCAEVHPDSYRVTLSVFDNARLSNLWPGK
jgi:hypothetical protein